MNYKVNWYSFTKHPKSDSCWSLSAGPDGRIYAASCAEITPGERGIVVRYNEDTDKVDYLFDIDTVVDDPRDSGRATQCKIHYSFVPSMSDGIMYMATHLSGPPVDLQLYSPWLSWHDPKRCFRGSALIAFDTSKDKVLWWETLLLKEGCRCLLLDEELGLIYALSYPRDHLFVFDLKTRQKRDIGRIGSINSQVLFLDKKHRVWTSSDYGHLVRYDPEKDRIEFSPNVLPHHPEIQNGWHSVLYDAVLAPDGESVFAIPWSAFPRLFRIWLYDGEWGRVEDLGPLTPEYDRTLPVNTFIDHSGGLTIAGDGQLYYVSSSWTGPLSGNSTDMEGVVYRLDPDTCDRERVAILKRPDGFASHYVTRGAVDHNGDLFFGHVNEEPSALPTGMFKLELPANRKRENSHLPIRIWG